MGLFGSIFGGGNGAASELIKNGAVIIDVRTPGEFSGGHVAGAKNIPLQEIQKRENEIMKIGKPVVFCCASGARSGQATSYFKSKGLQCENGGGWMQVNGMV
ncbi:MAG: rhodanese-like domain-containing protein [Crocinitomicaceae bacterium]|nr:rhodanese-like domain-containing protein [Crocinitomicaceae bacterium]